MIIIIVLAVIALVYWLSFSSYSQIFGAFPYRGPTTKKQVALTFDDGPNEPYTSQIVDFLDEQHIHATFFQVGRAVERHPEISKRLHQSGHVIGNHSLSHNFSAYFWPPKFLRGVEQTQRIIHQAIGQQPALFRPPWLFRWPGLLRVIGNRNLQPISGEFCHWLEVWQPPSNRIARGAIHKAKNGAIIIFHDGYNGSGGNRAQTVAAVKQTVQALKQQNYSFVTVDELLGIPPYKP